MLNYFQSVQECDATMLNRRDAVRYINLHSVLAVFDFGSKENCTLLSIFY